MTYNIDISAFNQFLKFLLSTFVVQNIYYDIIYKLFIFTSIF